MRWEEALKINQKWTAEQARNDLERLIITGERPADKVVGLACEALDKQIPKKPLCIAGDYDLPVCPECKQLVDDTELHCSTCGQALDWSDSE